MRYYVCTILTPLYALREAPFVTCRTAIAKLDRGQKRLLEWAEDINRIFENRKNALPWRVRLLRPKMKFKEFKAANNF